MDIKNYNEYCALNILFSFIHVICIPWIFFLLKIITYTVHWIFCTVQVGLFLLKIINILWHFVICNNYNKYCITLNVLYSRVHCILTFSPIKVILVLLKIFHTSYVPYGFLRVRVSHKCIKICISPAMNKQNLKKCKYTSTRDFRVTRRDSDYSGRGIPRKIQFECLSENEECWCGKTARRKRDARLKQRVISVGR